MWIAYVIFYVSCLNYLQALLTLPDWYLIFQLDPSKLIRLEIFKSTQKLHVFRNLPSCISWMKQVEKPIRGADVMHLFTCHRINHFLNNTSCMLILINRTEHMYGLEGFILISFCRVAFARQTLVRICLFVYAIVSSRKLLTFEFENSHNEGVPRTICIF